MAMSDVDGIASFLVGYCAPVAAQAENDGELVFGVYQSFMFECVFESLMFDCLFESTFECVFLKQCFSVRLNH